MWEAVLRHVAWRWNLLGIDIKNEPHGYGSVCMYVRAWEGEFGGCVYVGRYVCVGGRGGSFLRSKGGIWYIKYRSAGSLTCLYLNLTHTPSAYNGRIATWGSGNRRTDWNTFAEVRASSFVVLYLLLSFSLPLRPCLYIHGCRCFCFSLFLSLPQRPCLSIYIYSVYRSWPWSWSISSPPKLLHPLTKTPKNKRNTIALSIPLSSKTHSPIYQNTQKQHKISQHAIRTLADKVPAFQGLFFVEGVEGHQWDSRYAYWWGGKLKRFWDMVGYICVCGVGII